MSTDLQKYSLFVWCGDGPHPPPACLKVPKNEADAISWAVACEYCIGGRGCAAVDANTSAVFDNEKSAAGLDRTAAR